MPEREDPHDPTDLAEELRRLGYLEARVDRFLEPRGQGWSGRFGAACRLALVAGPVLALVTFGFHAVADPLLLAGGTRALRLLALLVVGEGVLLLALAFGWGLVVERLPRVAAEIFAAVPSALVGIHVAASWIRLRLTLPPGGPQAVGDAAIGVLTVALVLLFHHFFAATRLRRGSPRSRPWKLPLTLLPLSLAIALAVLLIPPAKREADPFDTQVTGRRVVWINLDGLPASLLDRALREGRMPKLAARLREGVTVPLLLPDPLPPPPELWTTITTGAPRERHGVHFFASTRVLWNEEGVPLLATIFPFLLPISPTPLSSDHRRVPTVGEIVSAKNFRVVTVNGWGTGPANDTGEHVLSDRAVRSLLVAERPRLDPRELAPDSVQGTVEDALRPLLAHSVTERASHVDAACLAVASALAAKEPPHLICVTLSGSDILALRSAAARDEALPRLDGALDRFLSGIEGSPLLCLVAAPGSADGAGGGVIHLQGEPVRAASGVALHPLDLAPLILRVLGFPGADDLPGEAPAALLTPEFRQTFPLRSVASFGERRAALAAGSWQAEAGHLDALRSLGYVGGSGFRR